LERTGQGWRADIEALMREMRRIMLSHPLPTSAARSWSAYGPNMLRIIDTALGRFLEAGLTNEQAAYATTTMIEFLAGATSIERSTAGRRSTGAIGSAGFHQLLDELPAGQFTALRAAGAAYVTASADDVFARGVAVLLDGVTSQIPSASGSAGADGGSKEACPPG
ncbi:MAG: TetR/AcrR family transcriptional regulator C-terminal domain-containing protein, partial [Frankia sp.]